MKLNILVTGGYGFIGSNFINYMWNKYPDYNFINVDIMYYCASFNNIPDNIKQSENFTFYNININDTEYIKDILKNHNIDIIVHFAAQSHVDNSFSNPSQYIKDNVMGTQSLLEAVKDVNKEIKFIHISTDEVYGESNDGEHAKTELSILCPTNPYAASKAAAEMMVNSYYYSFGLKTIITRGNNVYGPNQYPEKLIPKFISLLKDNKKCTIHGNGLQKRSFIYVLDVVTAIDIIMHKGVVGEVYNIGSDESQEKNVYEIANILVNHLKPSESIDKWIEYIEDRPFNDFRYFISNDKLKQLGWRQVYFFNDSILELIKQ